MIDESDFIILFIGYTIQQYEKTKKKMNVKDYLQSVIVFSFSWVLYFKGVIPVILLKR